MTYEDRIWVLKEMQRVTVDTIALNILQKRIKFLKAKQALDEFDAQEALNELHGPAGQD